LTFSIVGITEVAIKVMDRGQSPDPAQQLDVEDNVSGSPVSDQNTTSAVDKVQQAIETTRLAYLAVGCHVLSDDEADALFTVGLKNAYDGATGSALESQSSDLSLFKAKSDGISSATNFGACDSFGSNPQQVVVLRKQAQSAKAELAKLGQTTAQPKIDEPPS